MACASRFGSKAHIRVLHVRVSSLSKILADAENTYVTNGMESEKQPLARHVSSDCFCILYQVL